MTIYIQPNELIVGNMASKPRAAPLFPEFGVDFLEEELESFSERPYDRFLVDKESKREIREIISYWKGKTHCDRVRSLYQVVLPPEVRKAWDPLRFEINQVIKNRSHIDSGDGHTAVDYQRLLKKGLSGIIRDIKRSLNKLSPENPQDLKRIIFLEAATIVCQAAIKFAQRYSKLARELAAQE